MEIKLAFICTENFLLHFKHSINSDLLLKKKLKLNNKYNIRILLQLSRF